MANQTLRCLCSGWAAAAEVLFQSSKFLDKSRGKSDIRGTVTCRGGAQRRRAQDKSRAVKLSFT